MTRKNTRRTGLKVDTLEARSLMSVTYNPLGDVVELQGAAGGDVFNCFMTTTTSGSQALVVEEGVAPFKVTYTFDFTTQPVGRIAADLLGGNDKVTCAPDVNIPLSASGGDGNDTLIGGSGKDTLDGGLHNDYLKGNNGDDHLTGGEQNDRIEGDDGHDTIDAGFDQDSVTGGKGNDTVTGSAGRDTIRGNDGDDEIYGDTDNDWLYGDQGYDFIDGGRDSDDRIWGGTENDTLRGSEGNDTIFGEDGDDELYGDGNEDSMNGGNGRDTLYGLQGRDTLNGGSEADYLDGGTENDRLTGDGAVVPNPGNDTLLGGDGNDILYGDGANDELYGGRNNDTLYAGDGDDLVKGDENDDSLRGGNGNDRIYGGANTDKLYGDAGQDQLFGDQGTDTLDGGANDDTLISIDNDSLDKLWGRGGFDSFWVDDLGAGADNVRDETANEADTNLHFVDQFENADNILDGDGIADPTGGESSAHFDNIPLFSASGPRVTDVDQGDLADCWFLSSLATSVNITPNVAKQLIVDLGDGTFGVQIDNNFFRVDRDLPVTVAEPDKPQFAQFREGNESMWVPLAEKAWAIHRGNDYQNLNNDSPYFPLGKIGGTNRNIYHITDGSVVATNISTNGWAGVYCSRTREELAIDVVDNHCYGIIAILIGAVGTPESVVLYNPHGIDKQPLLDSFGVPLRDGAGDIIYGSRDGNDDGFITLTMEEFAANAQEPIGVITADFSRFR